MPFYVLINASYSDAVYKDRLEKFTDSNNYICTNFISEYIKYGGRLTDEELRSDFELYFEIDFASELKIVKTIRWYLENDIIFQKVLQELGWNKFYYEEPSRSSGIGELHMYPMKYYDHIKIDKYTGIEAIEIDYDLVESMKINYKVQTVYKQEKNKIKSIQMKNPQRRKLGNYMELIPYN